MKKIQVTKEYTLIDVEDLEAAVSKKAGRNVKLSEMDVRWKDCIKDDFSGNMRIGGIDLEIRITNNAGETECYYDYDLFLDDDENYRINGEQCSKTFIEEAFIDTALLFNFDTALFHSFKRFSGFYG